MSSVKDIFLDLARADTNFKVANANGILAGPGVGNLTGDKTGLTGYVSENLSGNVTNMTGVISPLLYGQISIDNGDDSTGMKGNITGLIGDITGVKNVNTPWKRYIDSGYVDQPAQNLVGDITGLEGELASLTGHASKDLVSTSIFECWGDVTGLTGNLYYIRGDVSKIYGTLQLTGNVTDLSGNISGCTGNRPSDRGKSYYGSPHYYISNIGMSPMGPEILVGDVTNVTGKIGFGDAPVGQIPENLSGHLADIFGDISNLTGNISGLSERVTGLWGEIKSAVSGNCAYLAGDVSQQEEESHFENKEITIYNKDSWDTRNSTIAVASDGYIRMGPNPSSPHPGGADYIQILDPYLNKGELSKVPYDIWTGSIFEYLFGGLPLETRKWYLELDETRQKNYLNFVRYRYEIRYAKGIHRLDTSTTMGQNIFNKFIKEESDDNDDAWLDYILKPDDTTNVDSVRDMWNALQDHTTDGTTYDTQYKKKIIIMLSTGDQKKLAGLNDVSKQNKFFENAGPTAAFWALSTAERTSYIDNITV